MSDTEDRPEGRDEGESVEPKDLVSAAEAEAAGPDRPVTTAVKKASRFSREYLATVISLVSTAFGVVAALAWNSAIQTAFKEAFKDTAGQITALFIYAVAVTLIGVLVIVYLGRLATRIGAQPVEFKFPAAQAKKVN